VGQRFGYCHVLLPTSTLVLGTLGTERRSRKSFIDLTVDIQAMDYYFS
jgi:hypothetical protein